MIIRDNRTISFIAPPIYLHSIYLTDGYEQNGCGCWWCHQISTQWRGFCRIYICSTSVWLFCQRFWQWLSPNIDSAASCGLRHCHYPWHHLLLLPWRKVSALALFCKGAVLLFLINYGALYMEGGRCQHQEDPGGQIIQALHVFCIQFVCKGLSECFEVDGLVVKVSGQFQSL